MILRKCEIVKSVGPLVAERGLRFGHQHRDLRATRLSNCHELKSHRIRNSNFSLHK